MVPQGYNALVGLEFVRLGPDEVELRLPIGPRHHQVHDIVHGGVWCTLVETAASIGAGLWLGDRGDAVGVSNHTDFLHAMRSGTATARATPIHRGRQQQLWLVEITDENGRLVARGEVRIQNVGSASNLGTGLS
jgi:1,4-dihydroxy-2-naphthoyl-CoA hydrolase